MLLVGPIESYQNPISSETLIIINKNPQIHYVGSQIDVRPYLKISDSFVLPSYREGFGMVLIEAGAMGVPCITTNIIGCNEIIVPGENGSIIEPNNQEDLFNEMMRWIDNPSIVKRMADNARRMVVQRYECHKVWSLYWEFYKSLLNVS